MDPAIVGKAVSELNEYLNFLVKAATANKETDASMTYRVSTEDATMWDDVQVFRPSGCHGIGMYYFALRTGPSVRKCSSIVLHSSSANKGSVAAIVLCVGFSGLAYAQSSSPLQYSLYNRMRDCMGVITKIGSSPTADAKERQAAAKALMSTLLLTEDDLRKTSTMVVAEQSVMIPEAQVSGSDGTFERIGSTLMTPINVVQQGGLTVVQGGLTVVHGGLFVVQGGLHVVSGGINAVTGGVLKTSTVQGGLNAVSGGINAMAGGVTSTGGLLMRTNLLKSIKSRTMSKKDIDITDLRLESESNASSADVARVLSERLAVISVVEKETILRRYEVVEQVMGRRSSMGAPPPGKAVKRVPRRRKEKKCADLNEFDFVAPSSTATKSAQKEIDEGGTRKSFSTPGLRAPSNDTSPKPAKRSSVPMLLAPRNDKASSRRMTQPLRRKSSARNVLEEKENPKSDFSSFDIFGNDPEEENQAIHFPSLTDTPGNGMYDAWGQKVRNEGIDRSSDGFEPFSDNSGYSKPQSVNGEGTVTTAGSTHSGASSSRRSRGVDEIELPRTSEFPSMPEQHLPFYAARPDGANNVDVRVNSDRLEDLYESFRNSHWASTGPDDDELIPQEYVATIPLGSTARPVQVVPGNGVSNEIARPHVQVNVALNEDLTCSYKQSKMASCTIEGVVQVQVKSEARLGAPFFLFLSDPRGHIGALQENRKYADDMSESLDEDSNADHKFTVSVPKADNYFPIMRYKCSNELRPVPIVRIIPVFSNSSIVCLTGFLDSTTACANKGQIKRGILPRSPPNKLQSGQS
jgi:hypothetical protein